MAWTNEQARARLARFAGLTSDSDESGIGFCRKAFGGRNPLAAEEAASKILFAGKASSFVGTPLDEYSKASADIRRFMAWFIVMGRIPRLNGNGLVVCSSATVKSVSKAPKWAAFHTALIEYYKLETVRVLYPVHERDKQRIIALSEDDAPETVSINQDDSEQSI